MKILHLIRSVDPRTGGPVEGLKNLASANSSNGHTVHVASLDRPDDTWVATCPVTCFPLGPSYLKYGYAPKLIKWLRLTAPNYDVVIVNGVWQFHSFAVWVALHKTSTPYFVFVHGMLDPYFKQRYPLKHLKKWLYWPWAEYRVLRDATAVLFTCEEERRLASKAFWLYQARELVVNYGVSPPPDDASRQRELFLVRFPHLEDRRILLSLGRIHPKKGLDLAIQAFAKVAHTRDAESRLPHMVIAGPDSSTHATKLKQLVASLKISDQVTFTGMLEGDAKWGAFRSADAFILTSYQENFGIAVVEALACGIPVFISDQVNIWREIDADGAGTVAAATPQGASNLVAAWFACDSDERGRQGRAALASFQSRFRADRAADSLIHAMETRGARQSAS